MTSSIIKEVVRMCKCARARMRVIMSIDDGTNPPCSINNLNIYLAYYLPVYPTSKCPLSVELQILPS